MTHVIGVLGGIGPESTATYYWRLIAALQRKGISANEDYPNIVINSIPAPELLRAHARQQDLRPYALGVRALAQWGADFIVMVCNTVHLHRPALQRCAGVPIIDIREALRATLRRKNIARAVIFGSSQTLRGKLYQFPEVRYDLLTPAERKTITRIILEINAGKNRARHARTLARLARKYARRGATILLACTELAMLLEETALPTVDTIDVMVDATLQKLAEAA